MKITTLASGSTGNCTLISTRNMHFLMDAGISMRRIVTGLSAQGLTPKDLTGIFVTHEHKDHINGIAMMVKHHSTRIFVPRTVGNHLQWALPDVSHCIQEIPVYTPFSVDGVEVCAFETPHDTPQSVGYRITSNITLGYCTDLGYIDTTVYEHLLSSHVCVLEANHDVDMLRNGSYPAFLKRRVLSDHGHLSNEHCGALAAKLYQHGRMRKLILAHLSRENNSPRHAHEAVGRALGGVTTANDAVELHIAPASSPYCVSCEEGLQS